jgi:GT2 family glycosyltransferase
MRRQRRSVSPGAGEREIAAAISRADLLAMRGAMDELQVRSDALEHELQRCSSDLLELTATVLDRHATGAKPRRGSVTVSPEAREVGELFEAIAESRAGAPSLVTVVIPAYQKIEFTLRCLRSIATTWSSKVNPTILVVDDASPDRSAAELMSIPGIDVLRNGTNLGYLRSSNRGADIARTPYVCFLNNDTEVKNGWLDALVAVLEKDPTAGAVGSKLVYPDGTLQEAGGIIWSDATGWNYGRGDEPDKSQYNYPREVDYCSAASLLVRTELLHEIGGFDERYAPAYYEDADLCFEVAFRGFRVLYEPRSEVIHHEGVSSGTDIATGVKRYQEVNRPKFAEKWKSVLNRKFGPSADNVPFAVMRESKKTVLIIDSYVPLHDREAGSNRMFKLVQMLRAMNYHVLFFPANGAPIEPYSSELTSFGVEVAYRRPSDKDLESLLASVLSRVDVAWICRPELCERFLHIVRSGSNAPIVYDTIDLHFAREKQRAELEGGDDSVWQKLKQSELAMAAASDLVVTVTETEKSQLAELGVENVAVIPTIHDAEEHQHFTFNVRSGIVFIGGYGHTPNVDAALWLCRDIMPIVWKTIPDVGVTLLGNNPPASVQALRSELITVTGFVQDVSSYFEEARLFVAPLRYGAGMKGKVGHALSYGLPLVATSVAIEGYDIQDQREALIADDTESFARSIVEAYRDETVWARLSENGVLAIRNVGSEAVAKRLQNLLAHLGVSNAA